MNSVIRREIEVAFSKHAQPVWFRITKYLALAALIYFFSGHPVFWWLIFFFLLAALALHLWYRYKTGVWTRSYGGWDFEKNKPKG